MITSYDLFFAYCRFADLDAVPPRILLARQERDRTSSSRL
jgi:hypothetical protein